MCVYPSQPMTRPCTCVHPVRVCVPSLRSLLSFPDVVPPSLFFSPLRSAPRPTPPTLSLFPAIRPLPPLVPLSALSIIPLFLLSSPSARLCPSLRCARLRRTRRPTRSGQTEASKRIASVGWRATRAGQAGTGGRGGIEGVAALARTDRGNGALSRKEGDRNRRPRVGERERGRERP